MVAVSVEGVTDQSREEYLKNLFEKAKTDSEAFAELDSIAAGRSDIPLVRELFQELDRSKIGEVHK